MRTCAIYTSLKYILLTVLIFCCGASLVYATSISYKFRNYTTRDGLPDNHVRNVMQDDAGFMWVGTGLGPVKFDGQTFHEICRYCSDEDRDFLRNWTSFLFQDSEGFVWIGNGMGVRIYDPKTEHLSLPDSISVAVKFNAITEDSAKNVWFTSVDTLYCYNLKSKNTERYMFSEFEKEKGTSFRSLYYDSEGKLLIGSNRGLFYWNSSEGKIKRMSTIYPSLRVANRAVISEIYEDSHGDLLLGSNFSGLFILRNNTKEVSNLWTKNDEYYAEIIRSIKPYKYGTVLISSDAGLIEYSIFDETYRVITPVNSEFSLSEILLYELCVDDDGGVWVGTFTKGLNYYSPRFSRFDTYRNVDGGSVSGIMVEDEQQNLWITSDDGGLAHFNTKENTFTNYQVGGEIDLSHNNTHGLMLDNDKLWVGTYTGGINIIDLKTKKTEHIISPYPLRSVYSIYKDAAGDVWLGCLSGMVRYSSSSNTFHPVKELAGINIKDICQMQNGKLYTSTYNDGLWQFNPKQNVWIRIEKDKKGKKLPFRILTLAKNENKLLLGTSRNGAFAFENDELSEIEVDIPEIAEIQKIIYKAPYYWISSSHGLYRYNTETGASNYYTESEGTQGRQYNVNSGILTSTGTMYFGGSHGITKVNIQNGNVAPEHPNLVFTNLKILYEDVNVDGKGILKSTINHTSKLKLKHNQNTLSCQFVALEFASPEKIRYRYKLEDFDEDWRIPGSDRRAIYTNIPSGEYILKVMATNSDGKWGENAREIMVTIAPPFWQTQIAFLMYFVLINGIIFTVIYVGLQYSRNKIRVEKSRKDKEVYQSKLNFLTNMAHEIRTPLSLIVGPLDSLLKSDNCNDKTKDSLNIIERNSNRMMTLVNELLDFRKIESYSYMIHKEMVNIKDVVANLHTRFKQAFMNKDLKFEFFTDEEDYFVSTDLEASIKILSNVINNGLKYTRTSMVIKLGLNADNNIEVEIADDGNGIAKEDMKLIFEPFFQTKDSNKHVEGTGLGLSMVKSLTEILSWEMKFDSELGKGTTVKFIIPRAKHGEVGIPEASVEPLDKEQLSIVGNNQGKLILLVDDNNDILLFLTDILMPHYRVLTATSGEEAWKIVVSEPVELVVSDLMMPGMNGVELCKKIQENIDISHIPVIILTANTLIENKMKSLEFGAHAYVEKPVKPDFLRAQIQNIFDNRSKYFERIKGAGIFDNEVIINNNTDRKFCESLNTFIVDNISDVNISIESMCRHLGVGRTSLFNKMKALYDMAPMDYVRIIRLKKSLKLLESKQYRINEVTYLVGFNTPSYFSKCFKKQFGCSPTDYHQDKNMNERS